MSNTDIIELVGIVITFILGIGSVIFSVLANNKSKEANKIAKEALELSKNINKKNMENVSFESINNPIILKQNVNIEFKSEEDNDFSDFYLILNIRINNKSFQAVTVNNVTIFIGKDGDETYHNSNDLIDIISYKEYRKSIKLKSVNEFPYYLQSNESKDITIVLGIMETDRLQFVTNGATLNFRTQNKTYTLPIKSANTLEY